MEESAIWRTIFLTMLLDLLPLVIAANISCFCLVVAVRYWGKPDTVQNKTYLQHRQYKRSGRSLQVWKVYFSVSVPYVKRLLSSVSNCDQTGSYCSVQASPVWTVWSLNSHLQGIVGSVFMLTWLCFRWEPVSLQHVCSRSLCGSVPRLRLPL